MQKHSLASSSNAAWTFSRADGQDWLPAQVPGGVHTDLLNAGLIPDPFFGDNELKVMWVAETDWVYRGVFELDAAQIAAAHIFLVADGLDTLADVTLNGQLLGKTYQGKPISHVDALAEMLLEEAQVAVVAGSAFGADRYLRISYAVGTKDVEEGLNRIRRFAEEVR